MASREKFPAIPEFYGGQAIGSPGLSVYNRDQWAPAHETAIPPTKQPLEYLFEALNDPRNAWMGIGPMAGAIKGARLIKPLVEAIPSQSRLAAKSKSLEHPGSEQAAKILDFNPEFGHTMNPIWGGRHQTAASFAGPKEAFQMPDAGGPLLPGQKPPTADEIVAAQNILKKMAQQNMPDTVKLFRGGPPLRHYDVPFNNPELRNTPIPATTDIKTATDFAVQQYGNPSAAKPIFELNVPREDLLANIEKLQRGRGYKESEYLIPLRAFQNAQTRLPFPNPNPYSYGNSEDVLKFEGAQVKDLSAQLPFQPQQTMPYGKAPFDAVVWDQPKGNKNQFYSGDLEGYIERLPNSKFAVDVPGLQAQLFATLNEAKQYLFETNVKLKH